MSDSDTNAGDAGDPSDGGDAGDAGFDKEAEREKLREKYARDEEKRESTRRMSELLLKGATMTNRHCDTCGDPLFRQNGQEFCVTCQAERPANGANGSDGANSEAGVPVEDAPAEASADEFDVPRREQADVDATERATEPALDERTGDDTAGRGAGDAPNARRHAEGQRRTPPSQVGSTDGQSPAAAGSATATPTADAGGSGDLAEAREALVAALTRHATAGADAADPRTARDHLSAAREAAEALSALRR